MTHEELLVAAHVALAPLNRDFVFLGGAVVPLYLTEAGRAIARQTYDADCTVRVTSLSERAGLDEQLRKKAGLTEDPEGHIGRWIARETDVGLLRIDVEPHGGGEFPLFYEAAAAGAVVHEVRGREIRTFSLPYLLATKVVAYRGRGAADPYESKDLEDLVSLLQFAALPFAETMASCPRACAYVAEWAREFSASDRFADLVEGHGGGSRAREHLSVLLDL